VIRTARQPAGLWRHVCLSLATLAIALKVLVPAGFMAAAAPADALPFALVICSGHGPLTVAPGEALTSHQKSPSGKTTHDSPCAFAGHGAGAPAPNLIDTVTVEFVAYRAAQNAPLVDLAPGRGLAAPPLPARGPPILLT
jgi:hypothetical protein